MSPELWHYTCAHTWAAVGTSGLLRPAVDLVGPERAEAMPWWSALVWLTDLGACNRDALGLSSLLLSCDRTEHRYRVTDRAACVAYLSVRPVIPPAAREPLESVPGIRLRHWWVSAEPVPVEYAPMGVSA